MAQSERDRLESEIGEAGDSEGRLAELFARLEARLGRLAASELWWGAFAARDATET